MEQLQSDIDKLNVQTLPFVPSLSYRHKQAQDDAISVLISRYEVCQSFNFENVLSNVRTTTIQTKKKKTNTQTKIKQQKKIYCKIHF